MLTIMHNLHRLNYRRIGLAVSEQMDGRVEHNWRAGYLVYGSVHHPSGQIPMLIRPGLTRDDFEKWLKKYQPDAVVGGGDNDIVLKWLHELKIRIPEDLGYVSCHLKPGLPSAKNVTGIDHREIEKGHAVVDMVVNQMQSNKRGLYEYPHTLLLPGKWVEGKTTRKQ